MPMPTMPTAQELAALPYARTPFSEGITTEDYKAQFVEHGDRLRHWQCFSDAPSGTVGANGEAPERNGALYLESALASDVRVMISQTERDVLDAEFGLLVKGQTQIACLPGEVELARGDRVLLLDKWMLARRALAPSGEASDPLERRFVIRIASVVADGIPLSPSAYALAQAADNSGQIQWLGNAPQHSALVNFWVNPLYSFLDVSDKSAPRGADNLRLPQRGILTLEKEGLL